MSKLWTSVGIALLLFTPAKGFADGLVYQLPDDGTSVRFDMQMTGERNGEQKSFTGSVTISSVGRTTLDEKKCRWIEFRMDMKGDQRSTTIIAKVLIPEKHLKKGQSPIDHVLKGWIKSGDRELQELEEAKDNPGGPLPVFLSGPLDDLKTLEKETTESKLGKLECAGTRGTKQFQQGQNEIKATIETRLHKKAPFGVVAWRADAEMSRGGEVRQNIRMTLKLADVGKNASTELPDAK